MTTPTTEQWDLEACPCCNDLWLGIGEIPEDYDQPHTGKYVYCINCGLNGPPQPRLLDAIAAWNTRPIPKPRKRKKVKVPPLEQCRKCGAPEPTYDSRYQRIWAFCPCCNSRGEPYQSLDDAANSWNAQQLALR